MNVCDIGDLGDKVVGDWVGIAEQKVSPTWIKWIKKGANFITFTANKVAARSLFILALLSTASFLTSVTANKVAAPSLFILTLLSTPSCLTSVRDSSPFTSLWTSMLFSTPFCLTSVRDASPFT